MSLCFYLIVKCTGRYIIYCPYVHYIYTHQWFRQTAHPRTPMIHKRRQEEKKTTIYIINEMHSRAVQEHSSLNGFQYAGL